MADEVRGATQPQMRSALEDGIRGLKFEQQRVELELQHASSRENELSRELVVEEARWNDLISRLEQLATK